MIVNNRTLAREWLILVSCLSVGFVVVPLGLVVLSRSRGVTFDLHEMYFTVHDWWVGWLLGLCPYILVQLVRSLAWAVRTLRG